MTEREAIIEHVGFLAEKCPEYLDVYHIWPVRNCINCNKSDERILGHCTKPENRWKQTRIELALDKRQSKL